MQKSNHPELANRIVICKFAPRPSFMLNNGIMPILFDGKTEDIATWMIRPHGQSMGTPQYSRTFLWINLKRQSVCSSLAKSQSRYMHKIRPVSIALSRATFIFKRPLPDG